MVLGVGCGLVTDKLKSFDWLLAFSFFLDFLAFHESLSLSLSLPLSLSLSLVAIKLDLGLIQSKITFDGYDGSTKNTFF